MNITKKPEQNKPHLIEPDQPTIGQLEVSDPTELEVTSQPWEIMVKPLDRGTFTNYKTYLMTPSVILYKESFSSAAHISGLTPNGMLGFTIPLKLGSQSLYWNASITQNSIPASLPGALDAVLDAGQVHIIVLMELSFLERMLTKEQFTALNYAAAQRLLPVVEHNLGTFTQWLLQLLSQVQQQADMFQHSSVLRSIEEDLLQQLMTVVRLPLQAPVRGAGHKRRQGFELAVEYLREADLSALSVPKICRQVGVSQRTLEYAFREHLNITPIGFIKKMRLHAVRQKLMSTHFSDTSISDTAFQQGIYDMGRFASIYKNNFGELPSQTLLKPQVKAISPFAYFM